MSRAVRVVESLEDLSPGLRKKVVEALARGKVKLPVVVENGDVAARLGFEELARVVRAYWRELAARRGIQVLRDPVALVEYWDFDGDRYTLKVVLPCNYVVELVLTNYSNEEAELYDTFTKFH